ncbi:hypothetical protein [Desulfosporosinus sp. OT]|nr:hypothetical protein DOT_4385 [Desulfosporosinus sp. OT]
MPFTLKSIVVVELILLVAVEVELIELILFGETDVTNAAETQPVLD